MTLIDFIRLVVRHLALLLLVPIVLGTMVILLTMKPSYEYTSQTILYTGLATGSSIEMDKKFSTQATGTAFDNLINIIKSRETQEEVAVRLLAMHLMLPEADSKYISKELYDEFKLSIPDDLYQYVEKGDGNSINKNEETVLYDLLPPEIDSHDYERTVQNLLTLMRSSTDNFIYELVNYGENKHYSLKALSGITAQRINSSDLIKLSYTVNDPGICQQTLSIYSQVCIKNYKVIKENRSGSVVKYFENELEKAKESLDLAENKLLEFNKSSNIINYYEQSKAVAVVKEELEVDFKAKKAELAGIQAGTKRLEDKLQLQEVIQIKSDKLLKKKEALGNLNYQLGLAQAQVESTNNQTDAVKIAELQVQAAALRDSIETGVNELYSYQNTIDGLQISKVLPDWMSSSVETEKLKAKIGVIDDQKKEFQEIYEKYAPAGANMKRLEREINVAEQGYLEILHGLSLAKLKLQDSELASELKTIDPPFYPLSPNPTKRTVLIIAAAFLGGILTLGAIFIMEYFDDTLRNSAKAIKKTGFSSIGMIPKIILDPRGVDLQFVQKRLTEIVTQNIQQYLGEQDSDKKPKTIIVFSTQKLEGKSIVAGNIARTLKREGKKVLLLNYRKKKESIKQSQGFSFINRILGYPDTRIDFDSPFLSDASKYLSASEYQIYELDHNYYNAKSYLDIIGKEDPKFDDPLDFVIIEIPAIIYNNYPPELFARGDIDILVCRSNRIWSDADESAMANLRTTCGSKIKLIVNGVELNEVESILGDLPKSRSRFRKKLKAFFKFQFLSKNQI